MKLLYQRSLQMKPYLIILFPSHLRIEKISEKKKKEILKKEE